MFLGLSGGFGNTIYASHIPHPMDIPVSTSAHNIHNEIAMMGRGQMIQVPTPNSASNDHPTSYALSDHQLPTAHSPHLPPTNLSRPIA